MAIRDIENAQRQTLIEIQGIQLNLKEMRKRLRPKKLRDYPNWKQDIDKLEIQNNIKDFIKTNIERHITEEWFNSNKLLKVATDLVFEYRKQTIKSAFAAAIDNSRRSRWHAWKY